MSSKVHKKAGLVKRRFNEITKTIKNKFFISSPPPKKNDVTVHDLTEAATPPKTELMISEDDVRAIHDLNELFQAEPTPVRILSQQQQQQQKRDEELQESPRACVAPVILFSPSKRELRTLVEFEPSNEGTLNSAPFVFDNLGELSDQLRLAVRAKTFSDVVIHLVPCKEKFYGHRVILSQRSGYFRTYFLQQCNSQKVSLEFHDFVFPDIFSKVLEYLYTGKIVLNLSDVLEVLHISEVLQVDSLKTICSQYMEQNIDHGNAALLLEMSFKYQSSRLTKFCLEFIDSNIKKMVQIVPNSQLKDISEDTLLNIIKRDELKLDNEDELLLFQACAQWAKHKLSKENKNENDISLLRQRIDNLLPWIRFPLMTSEQLAQYVEPIQLVPQQFLFEAYKYHLVKNSMAASNSIRTKPRAGVPCILVAENIAQNESMIQESAITTPSVPHSPQQATGASGARQNFNVANNRRSVLMNISNDKKRGISPDKRRVQSPKDYKKSSGSPASSSAKKLIAMFNSANAEQGAH